MSRARAIVAEAASGWPDLLSRKARFLDGLAQGIGVMDRGVSGVFNLCVLRHGLIAGVLGGD